MEQYTLTFADELAAMLPVFAASLAAGLAWFLACRRIMRARDLAWLASLPVVPALAPAGTLEAQLKAAELRLLALQTHAVARAAGRPSDRLFGAGLFVAILCTAAAFTLWLISRNLSPF
jgi:hypothetical protein